MTEMTDQTKGALDDLEKVRQLVGQFGHYRACGAEAEAGGVFADIAVGLSRIKSALSETLPTREAVIEECAKLVEQKMMIFSCTHNAHGLPEAIRALSQGREATNAAPQDLPLPTAQEYAAGDYAPTPNRDAENYRWLLRCTAGQWDLLNDARLNGNLNEAIDQLRTDERHGRDK